MRLKDKIFIHYKSGVAYKVIEDEELYIQENGEWKKAVMYVAYGVESNKRFIRSKEEFRLKFMLYGEDTKEIYEELLKNRNADKIDTI